VLHWHQVRISSRIPQVSISNGFRDIGLFQTEPHYVLIATMLNRHCACAMSRDMYPYAKCKYIYFSFSPPLRLFNMSLSLGSDEE